MYFSGIGTATPATRYTKAECLAAFQDSDWFGRLDARSHLIARTVLQRDNGIEARRLAVDSLDEVFTIDPDTLARRFLAHAPALATRAAERALAAAGTRCGARSTPSSSAPAPATSARASPATSIERLGLRADVQAYDLVGQGCAAALPNLQLGRALLASGALRARAVDLRRGQQRGDVPRQRPRRADQRLPVRRRRRRGGAVRGSRDAAGRRVEWIDSASLIEPAERKALMFEQRDGMLRNILTRAVPALAARLRAPRAARPCSSAPACTPTTSRAWIMHAGGRDVLLALERRLGARRRRPALQRGDAARVRQPVERLRLLRARGRAGRRCAGRLVVAVVVRRRLQLPRRAAARCSDAVAAGACSRRDCWTAWPPTIRRPMRSRRDLRRVHRAHGHARRSCCAPAATDAAATGRSRCACSNSVPATARLMLGVAPCARAALAAGRADAARPPGAGRRRDRRRLRRAAAGRRASSVVDVLDWARATTANRRRRGVALGPDHRQPVPAPLRRARSSTRLLGAIAASTDALLRLRAAPRLAGAGGQPPRSARSAPTPSRARTRC